jgi:hypothetical protein
MTPSTSPGSSLHARTAPMPGLHEWRTYRPSGRSPVFSVDLRCCRCQQAVCPHLDGDGKKMARFGWEQARFGQGRDRFGQGASSIWLGELHVELQLLPAARLPILVGGAHGWNLAFPFSPSRPPERWPRLARRRGTERWRNSHDQIEPVVEGHDQRRRRGSSPPVFAWR